MDPLDDHDHMLTDYIGRGFWWNFDNTTKAENEAEADSVIVVILSMIRVVGVSEIVRTFAADFKRNEKVIL